MPEPTFNRWFRPLSATTTSEGEVLILTDDEFDALFLEKNFSDLIRLHLEQLIGNKVKVRIEHSTRPSVASTASRLATDRPDSETLPISTTGSGRPPEDQPIPQASATDPHDPQSCKVSSAVPEGPTTTERIILSGLKLQYSFDRYVVGSCNEFAHAAAVAVADRPGEAYNPLFLYGSVGLGKTHLLNAIGIEVIRRHPEKRVLYQTAESFMNALIEHLQGKNMASFRSRYRDGLDVLLIDDIQFIAGKDATQQEFFHTFNALHQMGAQIIITSDRYPHEIPELEERLRSRFQWGLVADIQAPGIETRLAILKNKASCLGLELSDEVALAIGQNVRSNVRELEGALLRLHAFTEFNHQPLTVNLARTLLREFLQENTRQISVESIQKSICNYYNIKLADLRGTSRQRAFSLPRQIAMYLSKKYTGLSYPQLGEKFGGRDHTTVLAACQKITEIMETDRAVRDALFFFEKQLAQQ
ncbi:MAG: chromosomal replication initiator protein DnaA [Bradymonadales bacterium]|nr:chromosomal replication initiator protein DnaA [Bradymonadales bacterium]